jgi:hypothetical protein
MDMQEMMGPMPLMGLAPTTETEPSGPSVRAEDGDNDEDGKSESSSGSSSSPSSASNDTRSGRKRDKDEDKKRRRRGRDGKDNRHKKHKKRDKTDRHHGRDGNPERDSSSESDVDSERNAVVRVDNTYRYLGGGTLQSFPRAQRQHAITIMGLQLNPIQASKLTEVQLDQLICIGSGLGPWTLWKDLKAKTRGHLFDTLKRRSQPARQPPETGGAKPQQHRGACFTI